MQNYLNSSDLKGALELFDNNSGLLQRRYPEVVRTIICCVPLLLDHVNETTLTRLLCLDCHYFKKISDRSRQEKFYAMYIFLRNTSLTVTARTITSKYSPVAIKTLTKFAPILWSIDRERWISSCEYQIYIVRHVRHDIAADTLSEIPYAASHLSDELKNDDFLLLSSLLLRKRKCEASQLDAQLDRKIHHPFAKKYSCCCEEVSCLVEMLRKVNARLLLDQSKEGLLQWIVKCVDHGAIAADLREKSSLLLQRIVLWNPSAMYFLQQPSIELCLALCEHVNKDAYYHMVHHVYQDSENFDKFLMWGMNRRMDMQRALLFDKDGHEHLSVYANFLLKSRLISSHLSYLFRLSFSVSWLPS